MGHRISLHLRSSRALVTAFTVAGALLGFMLVSQGASGYGVNYCQGWMASGTTCQGPAHTLAANIVYDDTGSGGWVCDMATTSTGKADGGWGCGYGTAESCYPGNQLLHGWIANSSGTWLYMLGVEYYSQGCP